MALSLPISHADHATSDHIAKRVERALADVLATVGYAFADVPLEARRRAVADAAMRYGMREVDELQGLAVPEPVLEPEEFDTELAKGTSNGTPAVGP